MSVVHVVSSLEILLHGRANVLLYYYAVNYDTSVSGKNQKKKNEIARFLLVGRYAAAVCCIIPISYIMMLLSLQSHTLVAVHPKEEYIDRHTL